MKTYKFTKAQLTEAFRLWNEEYVESPDDFNEISEETKPENQATDLINYLEKSKNQ